MSDIPNPGYLVRLRAKVMNYNEALGEWTTLDGGRFAEVMLSKRPVPPSNYADGYSTNIDEETPPADEFYIFGKRVNENRVVVECTMKKDFVYNASSPTFHYWITNKKRFGIVFQTPTDANKFNKAVRVALEILKDGSLKQNERKCKVKINTAHDMVPRVHYVKQLDVSQPGGTLTSKNLSSIIKAPTPKQSSGIIKKRSCSSSPSTQEKKLDQPKILCKHCGEWYLQSGNRPSACEFAPDSIRSCINHVSCIACAKCMVYHCRSDEEGEFEAYPCACTPVDRDCANRWVGLTLLSMFVPCLCCYLPLRCARRAVCSDCTRGGMHAPFQH